GVLFVSAGYNLTRIDAATGTVLQQIAFPDGNIYSCNGGPTVADGMVFVGSGLTPWMDDVARSHYYAFDENDLTDEKWNITNGVYESATSTPAVTANKVVFGNGSSLTCADEANGDIIWSTPLVGSVGGSAAIDVLNDRVYVTTYVWGGQGTLYALNFTNGVEDWNATINYTSSTPAISGEYIYVSGGDGSKQGHTYCFNSAGVEQWNVSCGRWTMSPAIVDGKLFTGNIDPFTSDTDGISAFNATTGALIWQYEYAGSSPSVAEDADGSGIVVSVGTDGMVYAFGGDGMTGDANHDGTIDTADVVLALQMAVGAVPPNEEADVNHDGAVTSLDALMIMQAVAGAITI
ncbi:MAG: PQQ-binding-like beta-propeller repeat protein, partial [Methanosarcinales archaeon]|nr:PQQ-binding-like beta-propeller repeat protein [Methanosarcinales archaeon]